MTLASMQAAVARLLTDAAYQERFFADPPERAGEHGLAPEEFEALRRIDRRKLSIATEGYVGKRLERVDAAFPGTLAALRALDPAAKARYLAETPFPPDEVAERATFLRWVRAPAGRPAHAQRFLEDLADLEAAARATPWPASLPAYRLHDGARPRRAPWTLVVRVRGPLARALAAGGVPATYPAQGGEILVTKDGLAWRLEPLDEEAKAVLATCDGSRTLAELAKEHGPATQGTVARWLAAHALVDGA